MLSDEFYPLPSVMEKAFKEAEVVVFETSLDRLADPSMQGLILERGMYPPGKSLEASLSEKTYGLVKQRLEEMGLPIEPLNRFTPVFLALALVSLETQRIGLKPELGIDRHYYDRAMREGKKIVGLESPEEQIELIFGLDEQEQELFLESTIVDLENMAEVLENILEAWKAGDTAGLAALYQKGLEAEPRLLDFSRRLNGERNRLWEARLQTLMEGNRGTNILVIVGALHLAGEGSLVDLLQRRGYRLEQIVSPAP